MKTRKVLLLYNSLDEESQQRLSALGRPSFVGKHRTPESLNEMTFGDLIQLKGMKTVKDMVVLPCSILLGMDEIEVMKADYKQTFGFANFVMSEIIRINELFNSISSEPTLEEIQAGVEHLQYGDFGLIDYFAKRQGIADHDDALKIGWIRIYQCLKMDSEKIQYERRLNEIYSKKHGK